MPALVLASASPRRAALLASVGLNPIVAPSDIDETPSPDETPLRYAARLAEQKASDVHNKRRLSSGGGDREIVLGADTIVILDDAIIGKPQDQADAAHMLRQMSGRMHQVATAICVTGASQQRAHVKTILTDVTFKTLSDAEIARYLKVATWSDKAGGYAIQEHAAYMVRSIVGSYTNVVGLPLCETIELLEEYGIRPQY